MGSRKQFKTGRHIRSHYSLVVAFKDAGRSFLGPRHLESNLALSGGLWRGFYLVGLAVFAGFSKTGG